MLNLPFSQACENNKKSILQVLKQHFARSACVLEIGAGTGQHAIYFARHMPHLRWLPSDREDNVPGIRRWCESEPSPNLNEVLALDVFDTQWPEDFDGVYSANTAHIMPWAAVERMVTCVAARLPSGGKFCLYGPFKSHGDFTSESNRDFDRWLRMSEPSQGIRDQEAIQAIAADSGLAFLETVVMPANNQLLIWNKV